MSKARFVVNALALIVLTLGVSSLANAQATRTWVSGVGDDANPCSRTALQNVCGCHLKNCDHR